MKKAIPFFSLSKIMRLSFLRLLVSVILCLLLCNSKAIAGTTVIYVNQLSTCSNCDGLTWATAYRELSDAINFGPQPSANNHVQIWVAGGVYKPTTSTDRNASFELKNYQEIYGGFAGNEATLSANQHLSTNRTFLSGDIGQQQTTSRYGPSSVGYPVIDSINYDHGLVDNVYNVVTAYHVSVPNSCILSGVTITGGFAYTTDDLYGAPGLDQTIDNYIVPHSGVYYSMHTDAGGGMYLSNSVINVLACSFVANYARGYGGAVAMDSSASVFSNCTFANNFGRCGGGAFFELNCQSTLSNCVFTQNIANGHGGGILSTTFPEQQGVAKATILEKAGTLALSTIFKKFINQAHGIEEPGYRTWLTGLNVVANGLSFYSHTLNDPSFQWWADTIAGTWNKWGGETGAATQLALYISSETTTQADKDRAARIKRKQSQQSSCNSTGFTLLYNCTLDNNYAQGNGGAVDCSNTNMWFNRTTVSNNIAGFAGGAMYIEYFNGCVVQNSLFHHNHAKGAFSGIVNSTFAQTQIINSTFVKNSADGSNGECIASLYGSELKVANSILWDNTDSLRPNGGADIYNCTRATLPQTVLTAAANNYLDYTGITNLYSTTLQQFPQITQGFKDIVPICGAPSCGTQESGALNVGEGFMIYTGNNGYNPQLDSTNNYYPTNISPAINTGDNYFLSYGNIPIAETEDYIGGTRQLDGTVDRGAIEFGNGAYVPYNSNGRIYVDQHALAGGDGTSWGSAFRTMQEAFNVINHSATPVQEVWVAKGIYYPTSGNDRSATFLIPGSFIRYYGGFAGNETLVTQRNIAANPTILSGDIGTIGDSTDNSYHVLYTKDYIDRNRVSLDGFIISDGNASGTGRNSSGGGLYVQDDNQNGGYPDLENCIFTHNRAVQSGGAVYSEKTMGASNCVFSYNYALNYGGAVCAPVNQILTGCTFKHNAAKNGGAVAGFNKYLPVTHERCTFLYNSATTYGGAVYETGTDQYNIKECVFGNNNCNGSSEASGGAVYVSGDQYLVLQVGASTFANNTLTTGIGQAAAIYLSSPAVSNGVINSCIFWGNTANGSTHAFPYSCTQVYGIEKLQLLYSCFQNYSVNPNPPYNTTGMPYALGNIATDPQFAYPDTGNYRLKSCSPAIGAGANAQNMLVDIDSNARFVGGAYDMGAYEFQSTGSNNGSANITASATGVCPGGSLKLYNIRTNPGFVPDSVRWQVDKGDGLGFTTLFDGSFYTGTNRDTLNISGTTVGINNYTFRCINYSSCSLTSNEYQLYVYGGIIYVDAAATGTGNGSSWANAYTSLYNAIADADTRGCAQVWVKQGIYNSSANGSATQSLGVRSGVAVYGGFAGTETMLSQRNWQVNVTTIQRYGSTYILQASGNNIADSTAILDGFTITGGNADYGSAFYVYGNNNPTINNCIFINNHAAVNGGALHIDSGRITINNCRFKNNTANSDGGAMYIWNHAQAIISNCIFELNTANRWGGALAMLGNASAVITNCNFMGNYADAGGALKLDSIPALSVNSCTFLNNQANSGGGAAYITSVPGALLKFDGTTFNTNNSLYGGGLLLAGSGNAYFNSCRFTANKVRWYGGGMAVQGGTLHLYNSIVSANHANTDLNNNRQGAGIYIGDGAGHEIINCTVVANYNDLAANTVPTAAGIYCNTASVTIANSLVYTNRAGNYTTLATQMASAQGAGPYATTYYSCVYGGNNSNNNLITYDPQLVQWPQYDSTDGDLHLLACSPLINAGSANYLHTYLADTITSDIETNPRRYNNTMVDIGAYEAQRDVRATNPALSPLNTLVYYCASGDNTVSINSTGNNTYQWVAIDSLGNTTPINDDNVLQGTGTNALNFSNPPLNYDQHRYELIATSIDGCHGYATATLSVFKSRIYVDSTKINGLNDGTSWANAYTRLTDALTNAASNSACHTEIWVAKGTYYPTITTNRVATFNWPNNVSLYGGFSGIDTDTALSSRDYRNNVTILSGDIGIKGNNNDNSNVVITAANNITVSSIMDGFTITGGNGGYIGGTGAGIVMAGAGQIFNCTFTSNTAPYGGAAWVQGDGTFYHCNFYYNNAPLAGSAIYITGGRPRIINCNLKANASDINNIGSAIYIDNASPYIYNCVISGNMLGAGSGISSTNGSNVFVGSTTISGNASVSNLPGVYAQAGISGSLIDTFNIADCIIWGNSFNGVADSSTQVLFNAATTTVSNTDIQISNPYQGYYNYNTDPLFIDATDPALAPTMQGNLSLQNCSYLIDKGDNSYTLPGQVDIDSNARLYNTRIDVGAYELQSSPVSTINIPAGALHDTTVCEGAGVAFNLPGGITGTFTWQVSSGAAYSDITSGGGYNGYNTATLLINNTTAGINGYRYRCKVTSPNGCYFITQPATLHVNRFPTLAIAGLQDAYCLHYTQQITMQAIIDGTNYFNSVGTFYGRGLVDNAGGFAPVIAGLGPDTLYFAYTNSFGCSDTIYKIVNVVNPPDANAAGYQSQVCHGDSVVLTLPAANWYQWSTADTTQALTIAHSGTYGITVSSGGSCTASNSYTVSVIDYPAKPTISTSGPINLCQGLNQSVTLTANGGSGNYIWSNGSNGNQITIDENHTGIYTVSSYASLATCATRSDSIDVEVFTPPTVQINYNGPADLCSHDSATLNAGSFTSYLWNSGQNTGSITVGGGSYAVTVTDANGCTATNATTVTSTAVSAAIAAPNGLHGCSGHIQLQEADYPAINYQNYYWYQSPTNNLVPGGNMAAVDVTQSGSYYLVVQTANGCTDTSAAVIAYVDTEPVLNISPPSGGDLCAGTQIIPDPLPNYTYRWLAYVGQLNPVLVERSNNRILTVHYYDFSTNAFLEITDTLSGCTYRPNYSYGVSGMSDSYTGNVCVGGSANLYSYPTSSTRSFLGYQWSNGSTDYTTIVNAPGAYTVTVFYTGCIAIDTIVVPVTPQTATNVLSVLNNYGCAGSQIGFVATTTYAGNHPRFVWFLNGQNTGSADTSFFSSTAFNDGDTVQCLLISNHPCVAIDSVWSNPQVVHISPLGTVPTAAISVDDNGTCLGVTLTFSANVTGGGGNPQYRWLVNNTLAGNTSNFVSSTLQPNDVVQLMFINVDPCAAVDTVYSDTIVVHLYTSVTPVVTITADVSPVCQGNAVTFTTQVVHLGPNPHWSWLVNGVDAHIDAPSFTLNNATGNSDVYAVLWSGLYCSPAPQQFQSNHIALNVIQPYNTSVSANICNGSTYNFNGINLSAAGTFTDTLQSIGGCDSIVTLYLSVLPLISDSISRTICAGSSYNFNGTDISVAGIYTDTLQAANGCDSIVILTLNVLPAPTTNLAQTICANDTYDFYGSILNVAGIYNDTLQSVTGCDSIVILTLTVNPIATTTLSQNICAGSSYNFNGTLLTAAGTYSDTLQSVIGCDSIVILTLAVNPIATTALSQNICAGSSYNFNGTLLTAVGTYSDTLQSVTGCDSVVTLNLIINNPTTGIDVETACGSYPWVDGNTYTSSNNTATYTLTGSNGCDSVVTLNLTINNPTTGIDIDTACGSYTWIDGNTYTSSNNTATYTLTGSNGCDSVVTLNLTINNPTTGIDIETACGSYTWIDGTTYTSSNNTATYTLTSSNGCDSVVTLNLTINNPTTGIDIDTACGSYTWIDGNTYTGSNNTATYTLTGSNGCDSVVTLNLTINNPTTGIDIDTACDSYTWIDGNTYTSSNNTATYTLTGSNGCDSVVTLSLTINNINDSAQVIGAVCTAIENNATYQWIDCATEQPVIGATSQTFTAQQNGNYKCIIYSNNCSDTTNCVNVIGLGIDREDIIECKLFPNPNNGYFTLQHNYSGGVSVYIYNAIGSLMIEEEDINRTQNFNIESLSAGVYQVKLMFGSTLLKVLPLIKQ